MGTTKTDGDRDTDRETDREIDGDRERIEKATKSQVAVVGTSRV